jgi:alkanesulfonate monooxygenase SsuD/methylene tetrahydromethanopterin reductase-like flavin-dependent oxidoreductase (luciferase family)
MTMPRRMHLVAYLKTGPTANHPGAWRHPDADLHDIFEPSRYEHLARVLEAGCFDACFYADTFGLPDIHGGNFDAYLRLGGQISYLDPLTILPLMARVTRHLGLGATLSTTFSTPYYLARTLASLDMVTKGRAAWNVVTSATNLEARNFGLDGIPPKHLRSSSTRPRSATPTMRGSMCGRAGR